MHLDINKYTHTAQGDPDQLESGDQGGRREPRAAASPRQRNQRQGSPRNIFRMAARGGDQNLHAVGAAACHSSAR